MTTRRTCLALALAACSPETAKLPTEGDFPATGTDTASPDDTGEVEDTGDTGDTTFDPPWPTEGDGATAGGDMDCPNAQSPCNHQVRIAIGQDGDWTLVDTPIAQRASVPDALLLDHGELGGEPWMSLWLTYVDVFPANIPAEADVENILTTAVIAFPARLAEDPATFAEVLAGNGPEPWVYHRTNTWELGFRLVDPDREIYSDAAVLPSLDTVDHTMLVIDLDLEGGPSSDNNKLYLLESDDGFEFTFRAEVDMERVGTDPDCYPLEADRSYPGPVHPDWLPDGPGEWACNVSGYQEFTRYEGDLFSQASTSTKAQGVTVTSTTVTADRTAVYGHATAEPEANPGQTDLTRAILEPDGQYAASELILDSDDLPGATGAIQAPSVLPVADTGLELLVFHTFVDIPEG